MDNPAFYEMHRHYVKCQKSFGYIHNTSFALALCIVPKME